MNLVHENIARATLNDLYPLLDDAAKNRILKYYDNDQTTVVTAGEEKKGDDLWENMDTAYRNYVNLPEGMQSTSHPYFDKMRVHRHQMEGDLDYQWRIDPVTKLYRPLTPIEITTLKNHYESLRK